MYLRFLKIIASVFLLLFCIASVLSAQSLEQAVDALETFEEKLEWVDYRLALEQWSFYTISKADSLEFYQDLYEYIISDKELLVAIENGRKLATDSEDQRRFELAYSLIQGAGVELTPAVANLRDSLSLVDIGYRAEFEGERKTSNELYEIYRTDQSRSRRETAYRAYSAVGNELADGLSRLIRLRNQTAVAMGYNNLFTLTFAAEGLNVEEYLTLLKRLDSLSEGPYEEVLNRIRRKLGYRDLEVWDLAYAYADANRAGIRYLPADSQFYYVKRGLYGMGFDIDDLPIYFDLEPRDGKSQLAYAFNIRPPLDMRVLGNTADGLLSVHTLFHEIGHTLHSAFFAQERQLYAIMQNSAWTEGMAQIIGSITYDSLWLARYARVPGAVIQEMSRARRDQDIIYLRTTLARLFFEYEAYKNPNRDLNKLYWNLSDKYVMVKRCEEIMPWAKISHYITHPVYLQNYLLADIIAAQSLSYLEERYGSIVDQPEAKSFLVQNYFRFGARYDWRELLERGTGSKLDPAFLIERLGL